MTDLGCWRIDSHLVIRVHGSEHMLTREEAAELMYHLEIVYEFRVNESLGDGYIDICIAKSPRPKTLLEQLGLDRPKEEVRRRV